MDFDTARQRALADMIGPSVKLFPAPDDAAQVRSVKAQMYEMTGIDVREEVVEAWVRRNQQDDRDAG